jgi:hypothetical protein
MLQEAHLPSKLVGIHAGGADPRACWPSSRYLDLCRALTSQEDIGILVVRGEKERADAERFVAARPGKAISLAGCSSIAETAAALSECTLFVGNDSGLITTTRLRLCASARARSAALQVGKIRSSIHTSVCDQDCYSPRQPEYAHPRQFEIKVTL